MRKEPLYPHIPQAITISKQTIYKYGWQANNGTIKYTYFDTLNNKIRKSFSVDRICYHFERSRKRINPHNNPNIIIEPYIYFTHNNIEYRTPF
jgi:hypothetical protein